MLTLNDDQIVRVSVHEPGAQGAGTLGRWSLTIDRAALGDPRPALPEFDVVFTWQGRIRTGRAIVSAVYQTRAELRGVGVLK
jgi:hypothetical protein